MSRPTNDLGICVLSIFATRLVPSGRFLAGHSSTAVEKTEQVFDCHQKYVREFSDFVPTGKDFAISQKRLRFDYLTVDRRIVPLYHDFHGEGYTEKGMAPAAR